MKEVLRARGDQKIILLRNLCVDFEIGKYSVSEFLHVRYVRECLEEILKWCNKF